MIKLLHKLIDWFKPIIVATGGCMDDAQLKYLLPANSVILDSEYYKYSMGDINIMLKFADIDEQQYVKEHNDCDDFAIQTFTDMRRMLPQVAFGLVIGKNKIGNWHAWNCAIVNDVLWFIEPQDLTWFKPTNECIRLILI